jgi:hypothetical protein
MVLENRQIVRQLYILTGNVYAIPVHKHIETMGPRPASTFREENIMAMENRQMAKQSYILTGHIYATPILSFSQPWGRRLGASSYKRVRRSAATNYPKLTCFFSLRETTMSRTVISCNKLYYQPVCSPLKRQLYPK